MAATINRQQKSVDAEHRFLVRIAELGARLAPGATYVNSGTPVPLICAAGHACHPRPNGLRQGDGPCLICAGKDSGVAEVAFWAAVAAVGARPVVGAVYVKSGTPVALICAEGHHCSPRPNKVAMGVGICVICARPDQAALPRFITSRDAFLLAVAKQGARLAPEGIYRGYHVPVSLICARGHSCKPRPSHVFSGHAPCGQCLVNFDRVYLVRHETARAIKVGIASNSARLARHVSPAHRYQLVEEWRDIEPGMAVEIERECIAWWRSQGWVQVDAAPKDGRTETTSVDHLQATLDWLTSQMAS